MHHDGTLTLTIRRYIGQIKALRQSKIALDSSTLPSPVKTIAQFYIYFRTVKSAITLIYLIGTSGILQSRQQCRSGLIPISIRADRFFRSGRQLHLILKSENRHYIVDEGNNTLYFGIQLFRSAEDVGIILGKAAHPHETMKHSGPLMAMHRAELEETERKITITPELGLVDHHVGEAVHRLDAVALLVHLGEIHIFTVVLIVPRTLPELTLENLRTDDDVVIPL